jgi:hypothetical protein
MSRRTSPTCAGASPGSVPGACSNSRLFPNGSGGNGRRGGETHNSHKYGVGATQSELELRRARCARASYSNTPATTATPRGAALGYRLPILISWLVASPAGHSARPWLAG